MNKTHPEISAIGSVGQTISQSLNRLLSFEEIEYVRMIVHLHVLL